jgi:hypothetical protein
MGVQFNAYDPAAGTLFGASVDMSSPTATRVGDLLGLTFVTACDAGGECTPAQLRAGLERLPDGHRDQLVNQCLGGLLRLLLAAERADQGVLITWA